VTAQPRLALTQARVEQVDALLTTGLVTSFGDEGCHILDVFAEAGRRHMAQRNGGNISVPPGAVEVLAAVRAGAQRWRERESIPLQAVVAVRKEEPQLAQLSGLSVDVPDDELSSTDAAAWWRVSAAHVRGLAAKGQLPAGRGPRGNWVLERSFVTLHRTVAAAVAAYQQQPQEKAA
jgi:hypothetical protein